ncbi:MAG: thiamine-phosphate kinase [Saprospiraceae bacterium]|nr:thiamine-phosphate kinase [Saprospiraceae bacterium]
MEKEKRTEISAFGEFGLIEHLTKAFPLRNTSSVLGVGDDAALISNEEHLTVVTTDLLLEGIHFDLMYFPLKHLGYKSVVVNLSDICAMNAVPSQITVSLGVSNRFSVEALEELYAGIQAACEFYKVDLVGGDTSASHQGLVISVTAIGKVKPEKRVLRSTAKKGDVLCVTGDLGGAYLGLQILEREKQIFLNQPDMKPDLEEQQYIIGRQLKPEARMDMIQQFEKAGVVPTSMIDVSDGLSSDLMHLCKQSNLGAFIEESGVPIHPQSEQMALKFKLDPITCALSGGEDYELLFTIDPRDVDKVRLMADIYMMGEMVDANDGIKLHTKGGNIHELKAQGWKHF